MSYCRWSDSDCYVYSGASDRKGEIRCCSCNLRFVTQPVGGVYESPYPDFIAKGPKEMIAHLREHEAIGHDVPKYAFTRLAKEAKVLAAKPIKYPIHFLVSKLETITGEIIDPFTGTMPICGYHHNAHFRKLTRMKPSENGYAHHRDETTLDPKQVTCRECKNRIKMGLTFLPYRGEKKSTPSTTSTTK